MVNALRLSIAALFLLLALFSCSDDDDSGKKTSAGQQQIEEVVKALESMSDVKDFTDALRSVSPNLNIAEDKLTILAVKSQTKTKDTSTGGYTSQVLKRHIVKGANDLTSLTTDTLTLKSISDDILYVTKYNNQILINGIPLVSTSPTKAGDSYIYVVSEIVPDVKDIPQKKYKMVFNVLECNEEWSTGNDTEATVSNEAKIYLYNKSGDNYTLLDSVMTDNKGVASYNHNYADGLYYNVKKGDKKSSSAGGFLIAGIFTSQAEIDGYPQYRTGTATDIVVPGSVKYADINGDGIINYDDLLTSDYFKAEKDATEKVYIMTVSNVVSPEDIFISLERLNQLRGSLNETFISFVTYNYLVDNKLVKPQVSYPALYFSENNKVWETAYKYINNFFYLVKRLETPGYPSYILDEWNKVSGQNWSEIAYIYSVLTNYYGGVVLIDRYMELSEKLDLKRNSKAEVMAYVESLTSKLSTSNAGAVNAMLARYYANERDYAKAYTLSRAIMDSNLYGLDVNNKPFASASNKEVLLGGYSTKNVGYVEIKGDYMHPIRYREVLLTAAESALETGKLTEAMTYIDQIYTCNKEPLFSDPMNYETLKVAIRNLWKSEMSKEGFDYMLLNRWNILVETLGKYGAQSYNNLLPIPQNDVSANPNIEQNPGY